MATTFVQSNDVLHGSVRREGIIEKIKVTFNGFNGNSFCFRRFKLSNSFMVMEVYVTLHRLVRPFDLERSNWLL